MWPLPGTPPPETTSLTRWVSEKPFEAETQFPGTPFAGSPISAKTSSSAASEQVVGDELYAAHKELTEQIGEVLGAAPKFLCPLPRRSPDHALGNL